MISSSCAQPNTALAIRARCLSSTGKRFTFTISTPEQAQLLLFVTHLMWRYWQEATSATESRTTNRVQSANARGYTYDGNGNADTITGTASTSNATNPGNITLSWTSFNQPLTLPVAAAQNASVTATNQRTMGSDTI